MAQTKTRSGAALHALVSRHLHGDQRLYGIADSARDAELASYAFRVYMEERRWLFEDYAAPHMGPVAPYLVSIAYRAQYPYRRSDHLDVWADRLGTNAGILLLTRADPKPLWRHLRAMFRVRDEAGEEFYFRYYDPRVLRVYLPTCNAEETRLFFGPVETFLVESETPGRLLVCRPGRTGVKIEEVEL